MYEYNLARAPHLSLWHSLCLSVRIVPGATWSQPSWQAPFSGDLRYKRTRDLRERQPLYWCIGALVHWETVRQSSNALGHYGQVSLYSGRKTAPSSGVFVPRSQLRTLPNSWYLDSLYPVPTSIESPWVYWHYITNPTNHPTLDRVSTRAVYNIKPMNIIFLVTKGNDKVYRRTTKYKFVYINH